MLQYIRHMLTTIAFLIHLLQGTEWFIGTGSCCIREQLHNSITERELFTIL